MLNSNKLSLLLLLIMFTGSSCGFLDRLFNKQPEQTPQEELQSYQPVDNPKEYINMAMADFKANHDTTQYIRGETQGGIIFLDENQTPPLKKIYYMFDKKNKLLYEIIYEYEDGVDVAAIMKKKYGEPNNDDQWRFPTKSGTVLKIWKFGQKICIGDEAMFSRFK